MSSSGLRYVKWSYVKFLALHGKAGGGQMRTQKGRDRCLQFFRRLNAPCGLYFAPGSRGVMLYFLFGFRLVFPAPVAFPDPRRYYPGVIHIETLFFSLHLL